MNYEFNIDIKKKIYIENKLTSLSVKLNLKRGNFIAIIGKNGSGKTTFLRVLAGLEKSIGTIKFNNSIWLNNKIFLKPQKRDIGFVFQDSSLFENMTIEKNLSFIRNDKKLIENLLKISNLFNIKNRYPKTLSGGQKQKLNLCRALINKPKILLMDEPFSSLDYEASDILQKHIKYFHNKFNIITVMVSHNFYEIKKLANRIFLLEDGNLKEDFDKKLFFKN